MVNRQILHPNMFNMTNLKLPALCLKKLADIHLFFNTCKYITKQRGSLMQAQSVWAEKIKKKKKSIRVPLVNQAIHYSAT